MGPSGGGKTTLCNLIPTVLRYLPQARITLDGQDIRNVTLQSLRANIGVVQQDVYLFSGTVYENIEIRSSGRHQGRGPGGGQAWRAPMSLS